MLDKKAKVKRIRELGGGNYLLTLASPEQARYAQPGQFVMLKCSEEIDDNPLLRRPFSIFDVHRQPKSGKPAGFDLLVKDVGTGSHRLASLKPGQEIWILGPQGRPFRIRQDDDRRVDAGCLVAGGVGIAALYLLAQHLLGAGVIPVLFYGGRSADDLVLREYFEQLGLQTHYTTEDGSVGDQGIVTDSLAQFLSRRPNVHTTVYACGPWGMMRAVSDLAARYKIPCEVSLEARMGCSLGACMGCVVRTVDERGEDQYLRVCLEGPVMDSRIIDWDTCPL